MAIVNVTGSLVDPWMKLGEITFSAASSVQIPGISNAFRCFVVVIQNLTFSNASVDLRIQDGTGTTRNSRTIYTSNTVLASASSDTYAILSSSTGTGSPLFNVTYMQGGNLSGFGLMYQGLATGIRSTGAAALQTVSSAASVEQTNLLNLFPSAGTISGTLTAYGVY